MSPQRLTTHLPRRRPLNWPYFRAVNWRVMKPPKTVGCNLIGPPSNFANRKVRLRSIDCNSQIIDASSKPQKILNNTMQNDKQLKLLPRHFADSITHQIVIVCRWGQLVKAARNGIPSCRWRIWCPQHVVRAISDGLWGFPGLLFFGKLNIDVAWLPIFPSCHNTHLHEHSVFHRRHC